jgi:hypothetical protein
LFDENGILILYSKWKRRKMAMFFKCNFFVEWRGELFRPPPNIGLGGRKLV